MLAEILTEIAEKVKHFCLLEWGVDLIVVGVYEGFLKAAQIQMMPIAATGSGKIQYRGRFTNRPYGPSPDNRSTRKILKTPLSGDCIFILDCLYSVRFSMSRIY